MITDAEIYQGEFVLLTFTVYSNADKTARKDLSGSTAEYRVGSRNADTLSRKITSVPNAQGSSLAITDPSNGIVQVTIRDGDTLALSAKRYVHQLLIVDSAGKTNVVTDGYLTVKETLPST